MRLLHDARATGWRIVGIERHEEGAGLQHRDERDHEVRRAIERDGDGGLGAGAERDQPRPQRRGALSQHAVGDRDPVVHDRDAVRPLPGVLMDHIDRIRRGLLR